MNKFKGKVRLVKVCNAGNTPVVAEGELLCMDAYFTTSENSEIYGDVIVGRHVIIRGTSRYRGVTTTRVKSVNKTKDKIQFVTKNSVYYIEPVEEDSERKNG